MPEGKHFYEFGPFRLDPAERQLLRNNQTVPLAPKAFEVIVVGVSDVRVGVDRRAIAPVVIGVARAIGRACW